MTEGWFNRIATRTLALVFSVVLAALLVATALGIAHMQERSRDAADRAAVRAAAAARVEAAVTLSRNRGEGLRAEPAVDRAGGEAVRLKLPLQCHHAGA